MKTSDFPKEFIISEISNIHSIFQYIHIPVYFYLVFVATSLFFPGKLKKMNSIQELKDINIKNFTLQSVINNLSPINQKISIYISFLEIEKKEYEINGGLFIACFKDGISAFNFTGPIPNFKISNGYQIKIFEDKAFDYDTINTTIRIEQKPKFAKRFQITWIYYNQQFVLFNIAIRIISFILFIQLILYFVKRIKFSREILIEQRLTILLLILSLGYINPLYLTNFLISSQLFNLISNTFVDIFYSFFFFYFLSILTIFITKIKTDCINTLFLLTIPYCYFIVCLIILIKRQLKFFQHPGSITVLPDFPRSFNDFSDWSIFSSTHLKLFYIFCFIAFTYIIILLSFMKKRQKSPKFLYYIYIFLFAISILLLCNSSYFHSYSSQKFALFSCLEYCSIIFTVMLCAYGQVEVSI